MSRSKRGSAAAASAQRGGENDHEEDMVDEEADKKGVSGFISKIYKMVSDPATQDIVSWNDRGDGFVVKNEFVFASQMMRSYFRHQNFSSFVRQLNFYGFHKRSSPTSLTSFYHPSFRKGHPELLPQIQRKATEASQQNKDTGLSNLVHTLQGEVAELRQQNEDLFKIQQRILYIFSRYMRATQMNGQVGGGQGGGSSGAVEGSSGNKRIRSGRGVDDSSPSLQHSKRPRLLMEAKPDSPPQEYHSDNYGSTSSSGGYHPKSNSEYFHSGPSSAAASSNHHNSNNNEIVDVNTDQYNNYSNDPQALYGTHSLSDLNWAHDPLQAINDLIHKSGGPLQQVLNSSNPLPMQMGRPGQSTAVMSTQGQSYDNYDSYGRGGGRGGRGSGSSVNGGGDQGGNFLDINAIGGTNPKQLLELLERMGGGAMGGETSGNNELSARGGGSSRGRGGGSQMMSGAMSRKGGSHMNDYSSSSSSHSGNYNNNDAISGVFDDEDEVMQPVRGRPANRGGGGNKGKSGSTTIKTEPAAALTSSSSTSREPAYAQTSDYPSNPGVHISPVLDDEPPFPVSSLKPTVSPVLNSLPLPTSPVSPFIGSDPSLENFGHPMVNTPTASLGHSYSNAFELRSPNAPLVPLDGLALSRQNSNDVAGSNGNGNSQTNTFALHSPFASANGPLEAADLHLQPLTPNNLMM